MNKEKDQNIKVLVRVRPRNEKEHHEIIECCENSLTVKQEYSKTFQFDKVFTTMSTQQQVFDEISPLVDQVLLGFNTTVFAYGQTGAGKTHTMQGEDSLVKMGIIPRTLIHLFDKLEKLESEFSVRISYLEIYNEELKDLLSADDDFRKLRLYEDLQRKGSVIIQGLEEILVKSANDVFSILKRGQQKRQIAATKMNQNSSRSHAIFTITMHIKESTTDGEVIKVGKLHLVDLAGSENIQRSGAIEKRAKEAGMINQSLLTLGRVINALVERSPHVPYRESKLTRILQDSLGGRTKTCIIANISPSKCSIEETLSTLDYAHRAKNIRNKPEVNQKMTKKALIKEYVNEIELLKADLIATREKNGVYMTEARYESLIEENKGTRSNVEELKNLLGVKTTELQEMEQKFRKNVELLGETNSQLDKAMAVLDEKKAALDQLLDEMQEVEKKLREQEVLTEKHMETEDNLDSVATSMAENLHSTLEDVDRLHEKINRKEAVEKTNNAVFDEFRNHLFNHYEQIQNTASQFRQQHQQLMESLQIKINEVQSEMEKNSNQRKNDLNAVVDTLLPVKDTQNAKNLQSFSNSVSSNGSKLAEQVISGFESISKKLLDGLDNLGDHIENSFKGLDERTKLLTTHFDKYRNDNFNFYEDLLEKQAIRHELRVQEFQNEISSLQKEKERILESRSKLNQSLNSKKEGLLQKISHQLEEYKSEILAEVESDFDKFDIELELRTQKLNGFLNNENTAEQQSRLSIGDHRVWSDTANYNIVTSNLKDFSESTQTLQNEIDQKFGILEEKLEVEVILHRDALGSGLLESTGQIIDKLKIIEKDILVADSNTKMKLEKSASMITECINSIDHDSESFTKFGAAGEGIISQNNLAVQKFSEDLNLFMDQGKEAANEVSFTKDVRTGKTPHKKSIVVPTWQRTADHQEIIAEFWNGQESKPSSNSDNYSDSTNIYESLDIDADCNGDLHELGESKLPVIGKRKRAVEIE